MLHGPNTDEAVSAREPCRSYTDPLFWFSKEHDFFRAIKFIQNVKTGNAKRN
jgi:hypothetical protein